MTIYIPTWLYWYGGLPFAFVLGYMLGWTRKPKVPPDPYRDMPAWTEAEAAEFRERILGTKEASTAKRGRPVDTRDEGES